jgi:hypothetical protein
MWTDRQMYRHDKFSVAFHNFANMPKNYNYMTAVHEITILNESLKNALEIWNSNVSLSHEETLL